MPRVTQQQLQCTTCGRYQQPVFVSKDRTYGAQGKLETLLNKFFFMSVVEEIIFWMKGSDKFWMSCAIKLSLLDTAGRPFTVLTESNDSNNGLLQHFFM